MAERAEAGVRQALFDLQRYLSDQLAPMMVTDSVELLLHCPPQLVANEIQGWVDAQFRAPEHGLTVSDCVYHAMKKIHLMAEFDLIEKQLLEDYMEGLGEIVIGFCPEGDRDFLRQNLARLGQAENAMASPVAVLHRQGGREAVQETPASTEAGFSRGMQQFSLLIERLARNVEHGDGSRPDEDLTRHAFATAAVNSRNEQEFRSSVQRLSRLGIDARMDQVFRALGAGLPGWTVPVPAEGGSDASTLPPSRSARAMRRILEMTEDPEEGARRFNEMMQAAIEQFNEGRLVQAMTMLDLAERIVTEKKLDAEVVKSMRGRAHETLSPEKLWEFADRPDKHDALRPVLGFFPALTPKGLLRSLHEEKRRERRKLLLALLEVHGAPVRILALELLESTLDGAESDPDGFFRRNLVYLLRRVPRSQDAPPIDRELDLMVALSGWGHPPLVIKEAVAALGTMPSAESERTLMKRLAEMEQMLVENDSGSDDSVELIGLVDRTIAALAQLGTTNAYRTIVTHALKREPKLGDTAARLEQLTDRDLSGDRELVIHLVKILKGELPSKVLGFVVGRSDGRLVYLVRALSGTQAPAVRQLFDEIASRFSECDFAEAARNALAGFGAQAPASEAPSKTLTGDVELFGLPNLFQTLADSQVTGVLTLADPEGETAGLLSFEGGRIHGCQVGSLRGESAVYQLFEKPVPGTFTFTSQASSKLESDAGTPPMEVLPTVLEAMRRYDELTQTRALVPDDSAFKPGSNKPGPMDDEPDVEMTRAVWDKASGGVTPETCESVLPYDSYRIRRLYAHWIENGSLEPR